MEAAVSRCKKAGTPKSACNTETFGVSGWSRVLSFSNKNVTPTNTRRSTAYWCTLSVRWHQKSCWQKIQANKHLLQKLKPVWHSLCFIFWEVGGSAKLSPQAVSWAMVKRWGVSEFESWEGEGAHSRHLALPTVRRKHMPTLEMLNVSDKLNINYSMQLCFPILNFQLIGNTLYIHGSWFVFPTSGFAEFQVLLQLLQGWFGAIDGDKTKIRMMM